MPSRSQSFQAFLTAVSSWSWRAFTHGLSCFSVILTELYMKDLIMVRKGGFGGSRITWS